jgi:hypothetical protein
MKGIIEGMKRIAAIDKMIPDTLVVISAIRRQSRATTEETMENPIVTRILIAEVIASRVFAFSISDTLLCFFIIIPQIRGFARGFFH